MKKENEKRNEKKMIVFIDCGDTLVDEGTQIVGENGDVLRAGLIEGAGEMLQHLYESGYRIALVADGRVASFRNIIREHGWEHIFEATVISEEAGVEKPHRKMFQIAMERMGLTGEEQERIVMIGNNLERDVLGANRMGICSVLLSYSPRYRMTPEVPDEQPVYTVGMPREIPALLAGLEQGFGLVSRPEAMNIRRLALWYLPCFFADEAEPFPIVKVGYTLLRESGDSPSFNRQLNVSPGVAFVIEYAIYFDFDIQHLYDLEHVWVYVGEQGEIVNAEASAHGRCLNCLSSEETPEGGHRLRLYFQPGKHAILPEGGLSLLAPDYAEACDCLAGKDGVLVPEFFREAIPVPPGADETVEAYIRNRYRFRPTLHYRPAPCDGDRLVPLERLFAEIPDRINEILKDILVTEKDEKGGNK